MRLIDADKLEMLFWHQIDLGNNAMDAFDDALQDTETLTMAELAGEIKEFCATKNCNGKCPFWHDDVEGYCVLSDGVAPTNWEV